MRTTLALVIATACAPSQGGPPRGDASGVDVAAVPLRVFATGAFAGTLYETPGGLAAGDTRCASAASEAGLDGTWRAWLSTATVDAIERIGGDGPWTLPDRTTVVFGSRADLATGPAHAIDQLADGQMFGTNVPVWTGTTSAGTVASATCIDWTDDRNAFGRAGRVAISGWTDDLTLSCTSYAYIYCFEQP